MSKSKSSKRGARALQRAILLMERDQPDKAYSILVELLRRDPTNALARKNAAIALYNIGNRYCDGRVWDSAVQSYLEALSLDPDYVPAYYNLGLAYGYLPDYDLARKWLKKTLKLEPDHAKAHLALGFIHYDSGRKKKAREHLEKYLELEPDSDNAAPVRKILSSL